MIVYTAISGGFLPERKDILCYTDYSKFKRDVYNAKIYKLLPWLFMETDVSLWLDGNISLNVPPEEVLSLLDGYDMALFKHPWRDCVYKEGLAAVGCYRDGDIQAEIFDHLDAYKAEGYPKRNGLWECGILLRRHNKAVKELCLDWFAQVCRYSNRDQISFPYVLSKHPDVAVHTIDSDLRKHPYFTYEPHSVPRR